MLDVGSPLMDMALVAPVQLMARAGALERAERTSAVLSVDVGDRGLESGAENYFAI